MAILSGTPKVLEQSKGASGKLQEKKLGAFGALLYSIFQLAACYLRLFQNLR
jgi:hypothetical protein